MSEKQLKTLLDEFVKSSQIVSSLQEGILSLHGVMEEFHKTAEDFTVKHTMDALTPVYQKLQAEIQQLQNMQSGMADVVHEISANMQEMNVMQQQLAKAMIEYRQMMTESQQMQGELLTIAEKNLAMSAFIEKIKGADGDGKEYFNAICEQWQKEHLDEAVKTWIGENIDEVMLKTRKGKLDR